MLEQEDAKNTSKVITPILLTIGMHIEPTRLLENIHLNSKYDSKKKFCKKCTNTNWDDDSKIKNDIAADNVEANNEEDFYEKNRWLKKKK